jgi:hypothetical protein
MGLIIGGILTGIIVWLILNFSLRRISRVLAIIVEIVGTVVLVVFKHMQVIPTKFIIALAVSYLVSGIILGLIMSKLDD